MKAWIADSWREEIREGQGAGWEGGKSQVIDWRTFRGEGSTEEAVTSRGW